jgi:hypothetical protein
MARKVTLGPKPDAAPHRVFPGTYPSGVTRLAESEVSAMLHS